MNENEKLKALHLVAEGEFVLLKMEVRKGIWVILIKERLDSPFSHIIEPQGIENAINSYEHPDQQMYSEDDI